MKKTKRNHDPRIAREKHMRCLINLREDYLKTGKIKSPSNYMRNHNISPSVVSALLNLGVIKEKEGVKREYAWVIGTEITYSFVERVRDEARRIVYASGEHARNEREKNLTTISSKKSLTANSKLVKATTGFNIDVFLDVYDMLPEKLTREEKKETTKKILHKFNN